MSSSKIICERDRTEGSTSMRVVTIPWLLALLLSLSFVSAGTSAQTTSTSSTTTSSQPQKGADVLVHARTLYSQEGPKAALPEFEKALALFRSENDRLDEAITIGLIGNCY